MEFVSLCTDRGAARDVEIREESDDSRFLGVGRISSLLVLEKSIDLELSMDN